MATMATMAKKIRIKGTGGTRMPRGSTKPPPKNAWKPEWDQLPLKQLEEKVRDQTEPRSGITWGSAYHMLAEKRKELGINDWFNDLNNKITRSKRSSVRMQAVRLPREEPNGHVPRVELTQAMKAVDRGFAAEQVGRVAVDHAPGRLLELVSLYLQQRALTEVDLAEKAKLLYHAREYTELRLLYEQKLRNDETTAPPARTSAPPSKK